MKNFNALCVSSTFFALALGCVSIAQAELPVKLAVNSHWGASSVDTTTINEIVNGQVASATRGLMQSSSKYQARKLSLENQFLQANVKVLFDNSGDPDHLLVNLLSTTNWGVETLRVNVDNDYNVTEVITNYEATSDDYAQGSSWATGTCPDSSVQMVFLTPHDMSQADPQNIQTAKPAINNAASDASNAGFSAQAIVDSSIVAQDHLNWMACDNLMLLGRVGHGSTGAIHFLSGDSLDLTAAKISSGMDSTDLSNTQIYYNSCQVHNNGTILDAITNDAGAKVFIGGDVDLTIGPSEDVFNCWVENMVNQASSGSPSSLDSISNGDGAEDILTKCEEEHYRGESQTNGNGIGDHGYYAINSDTQYLAPADPCAPSLSSGNASFTDVGGNGTVSVTLAEECLWTATSNDDSWLSISSGVNYTGPATVSYDVATESDTNRTGTITIAGATFTVTQANIETVDLGVSDETSSGNHDEYGPYELADDLTFTASTTGDTGSGEFDDIDLFVYRDVSSRDWDNATCLSTTAGSSTESCELEGAGTYYVRVGSRSRSSLDYTLNVHYENVIEAECDSGHPGLCSTQQACEGETLNWCDGACQVAECTPTSAALTIDLAGNSSGTVTSDPAGIDCGETCNADFDIDTVVTLTALPAANTTFAGWSGSCTGTGTCQVTLNEARAVTATFSEVEDIPGDANQNGHIDLADAIMILQVLTGL